MRVVELSTVAIVSVIHRDTALRHKESSHWHVRFLACSVLDGSIQMWCEPVTAIMNAHNIASSAAMFEWVEISSTESTRILTAGDAAVHRIAFQC